MKLSKNDLFCAITIEQLNRICIPSNVAGVIVHRGSQMGIFNKCSFVQYVQQLFLRIMTWKGYGFRDSLYKRKLKCIFIIEQI